MRIEIINGSVEYDGNTVLSEINFSVSDKEKIALVGRNGSGKTSILKCISGEVPLVSGTGDEKFSFSISGAPKIGYLQQVSLNDELTLRQEILSAYKDVVGLENKLQNLLDKMSENPSDENVGAYSRAMERFENIGGYLYKKEYLTAVSKFGFSAEDLDKKLSCFSGGQRTKIALMKLLLEKPDVLLLDEPTNHLDIAAVEWLEGYLKNYKNSVVIVSHDCMFLDRIVGVVYEIEYGVTTRYKGNYTAFLAQKQQAYDKALKDAKWKSAEIDRLRKIVERFRYKATKAAMAQSKLKEIERIGTVETPRRFDTSTFASSFQPEYESVRDALFVKDLVFGYDKPLGEISLAVERGQKIGVIGSNGTGKSTLLKTITGLIPPLSGDVRFGVKTRVGYFDQTIAATKSELSVLEDFRAEFPELNDGEIRKTLGGFLLSGDDVFKCVKDLSGGEKVRLALSKIFRRRPNFLILDEPTNHMDIIGKETLEKLLMDFSGTVIVVSHDRYLINRVAKSLIVFENGGVRYFDGTFDEYEEKEKETTEEVAKEKPEKTKKTGGERYVESKEEARRKHRVEFLEKKITALEEELSRAQAKLDDETVNTDYKKVMAVEEEIKTIEEKLDPLITEWTELSE
ncbi:MAG: ABC-F family ATP-binding cassette domain-containing protein [Eubacteriales bacterium]|nr:ABC-F family ATP-binding cassette domain-containing protein [Clostridiales bacterium]MDY5190658.1 ABC-F family ATP-binding cassette domain-containing protein [Eubacteriales bacterium]